MALLIFYVSLALGVSFLCSILEAVILSVSPSFIARMEQENNKIGKRLKMLKENVDRPLAAILSLNTIAHTVGAAGAGAQATAVFGNAYIGIISAILTFLILVISEIIPKTLGAIYWRKLAPTVVSLIIPIIWLMWPLVKMAELITKILGSSKYEPMIRRGEFIALTRLGTQEGILAENESLILKNLFRFNQLSAKDIMTPRTVIFALKETIIVSEVIEQYEKIQFSRIPIFQNDLDNISGYILKSDLYYQSIRGKDKESLSKICRPLMVIPADLGLDELFEKLVRKSEHIAHVVDEYGGTSGIVTLEDLMETLIGLEIVDESDSVEDMQKLAREQWNKRAGRLGISNSGE
jgi:CBS domain containing-hemolysin-like protein